MKCIHCNQEFKSKRKTAKYCSDLCRKRHSRKDSVTISVTKEEISVTNSDKPVSVPVSVKNDTTSVPLSPVITDKVLKDYTAQDLYDAIDSYPSDAWVNSPEYKELGRRLDTLSVPELESACYYVPSWKRNKVKRV